jgi:hypothetical protein
MPKMIQVRNVPDRMHRELVRRARREKLTLTDYVQAILGREVSRPRIGEVLDDVSRAAPVRLGRPVADLLRAERRRRAAS